MISVLVAAASAVARSGLKSLVDQTPDCTCIGSAPSITLVESALELRPDVVLWQMAPDEDAAPVLHSLPQQPVVVIGSSPASELLRAGARGVLGPDSTEAQIAVAVQAAAADLIVFSPDTAVPAAPSALSARETQVLRMIAEGLANKEIAWKLGISEHTVKFHVSALLGKLGAASRAEAVGAGVRQGIIML